jgi:hypothetical protein
MENHNLLSDCGLYCGSCGVYIATQENDEEKLRSLAHILNQSIEDTLCDGCGSERRSLHCQKICTFITCKKDKGVEICSDCQEFPCQALQTFIAAMPHRVEIIDSLKRLKEIGSDKWLLEKKETYTCRKCSTINSAYDLACRKCGNTPSCSFVERNKDTIAKHFSR